MRRKILSLLVSLLFLTSLSPARAAVFSVPSFDPSLLLTDQQIADTATLTEEQIQAFLVSLPGTLPNKTFNTPQGSKTAAQIIYEVSQRYQINPQYLLALLQKEQSLLTDPQPTVDQYDWATGFGVCDSCTHNDPAIQQYRGFYNQLERAAWRNRYYLLHPRQFFFQVGQTYAIDGQAVTIQNAATAALYNYTPHLDGNLNFWRLWNNYFGTLYPDGTVLQASSDNSFWLIANGKRRRYVTLSAYLSRVSDVKPIKINSAELIRYPMGDDIRYGDNSFLKGPDNGVYLVTNNQKRKFASRQLARLVGVNPDEMINASQSDLDQLPTGPAITSAALYPTGALLQNKETGAVYFVQNGVRHPVPSREVLARRFPNQPLTIVLPANLESYPLGQAVNFGEGALVKKQASPVVYVVSNGYLRPIASEQDFNKLGYDWKSIITVPDQALTYYPVDLPVVTN